MTSCAAGAHAIRTLGHMVLYSLCLPVTIKLVPETFSERKPALKSELTRQMCSARLVAGCASNLIFRKRSTRASCRDFDVRPARSRLHSQRVSAGEASEDFS
jgi:hypothetical protein